VETGPSATSDRAYDRGAALVALAVVGTLLGAGCARRIEYPVGAVYRDFDGAPLIVDNQAPQVICYVRIRPDWQAQWGPDQLGTAEIIREGARRIWHVPPGRYALLLLDCNRRLLWEGEDLPIGPDGGTVTLRGVGDGGV